MMGWRKGEARSRLWGKVEEKGGFKQWQQQPSRKEQLLPVTNSHCCRLAHISRAASRDPSETVSAAGGVGRTCMNETAIDFGSDRGRAHVHIRCHACNAARACVLALMLMPMLMRWRGRLIRGASIIGRRGLVHIRRRDIAACAYLLGWRTSELRVEGGAQLCFQARLRTAHSCLCCSCVKGGREGK